MNTNMQISLQALTPGEALKRLAARAAFISGHADDYWEGLALGGSAARLLLGGEDAGFVCYYTDAEAGVTRLTAFHTERAYELYAQRAFAQARALTGAQEAYVPTGDTQYLNLALDSQKRVETHSLVFTLGERDVKPARFDMSCLRLATPEDERDILDEYGVLENIRLGKYYVLRAQGKFLGQGFYNEMRVTPHIACIGMSVAPEWRMQGVGRSIIIHLTQICKAKGKTPLCGCYVKNTASQRTLESAGFIPDSRLLRVIF